MRVPTFKALSFSLCTLLILALEACTSVGPKILPQNRYGYNIAVGDSNSRELLLNIVRLRYDDPPFFLNVTNISAGFQLQQTARAAVLARLTTSIAPASAEVSYHENPIINYVPVAGQKYASQLLTPLSLANLGLVLNSGWNIARIFRIAVQCVGKICNAPSAARPTSTLAPRSDNFIPLANLLRDLQVNDLLTEEYYQTKTESLLILHISPAARLTRRQKQIARHAGIKIHQNKIILTRSWHPKPDETFIETRSEFEILNYISKGVMLSPIDIEKNLVVVTRYPDGRPFDWQSVLWQIMTICQKDGNPPQATLAVRYRGRWFYIPDSDEYSKKTIILLSIFLELVQAREITTQPVYAITQNSNS